MKTLELIASVENFIHVSAGDEKVTSPSSSCCQFISSWLGGPAVCLARCAGSDLSMVVDLQDWDWSPLM
ncbi:hypothetical protein MHYP_G00150340 [Metynnis hypsauchen]